MAQPKDGKAVLPLSPEPTSTDEATTANPSSTLDEQTVETVFAALKTLLSTVEKLQNARQSVGDIKPLLIRLLDGEMLLGEELEQLKASVGGLSKLIKFYGDYQDALVQAQPARALLDEMLKTSGKMGN